MNSMNIPGFTGEASLYRSRGYYGHVQAADSHPHNVVPQLRCVLEEGCVTCCHVSQCCTACEDVPPFCNF
jgi:hypothetical protein